METRVNLKVTEPAAFKAMYALESYVVGSQLSKTHKDLIKIRASQVNSCAFCIDMHTKEAINHGESLQRIFLLNAWRETTLFTEEERVILSMTEEITLVHQKGLTEDTYQKASQLFDPNYLSQLIIAIAAINTWNRLAISTHMQPGE